MFVCGGLFEEKRKQLSCLLVGSWEKKKRKNVSTIAPHMKLEIKEREEKKVGAKWESHNGENVRHYLFVHLFSFNF